MNESSDAAGSNAVVPTNESLSLLTNTTNSLSFGTISSVNDENGDHNDDGSNRINESENNNNDITGGSSTQVNEFSDVVSYYQLNFPCYVKIKYYRVVTVKSFTVYNLGVGTDSRFVLSVSN